MKSSEEHKSWYIVSCYFVGLNKGDIASVWGFCCRPAWFPKSLAPFCNSGHSQASSDTKVAKHFAHEEVS